MASKLRNLLARGVDALGLSGAAPVHYHLGRPNFGDDLNPWFWGALAGARFRWGRTDRPHLLGVGSIAALATGASWVMGSGLLRPPPRGFAPRPARLVATRGRLTAEAFRTEVPHLGDPVLLLDRMLPRPAPRAGSVGVVPHAVSVGEWRRALRGREDLTLIDPRGEPAQVISAIARCERVASQSLHGMAVADAYGIPAAWVEPAAGMVGGRFKFDDYFTAFAEARRPVGLADLVGDPAGLPWTAGRYLGDKDAYLGALREGAREFLAREAG